MSLSSLSNFETVLPQYFFDSEMMTCSFQQITEAELPADDGHHFLQYYSDYYSNNNFLIDPCMYDPFSYNLLSLENHDTHPLLDPYDLSSPHMISLAPHILPLQDFHPYPYPKRHKSCKDYLYPDFTPTFSNGFAPNSCHMPELLPPGVFTPPSLKFPHPGKINDEKTYVKKVEEKCVLAQSIAARERRRKITEKTQELGKLVPGGSKMNTAEMLTAAYNYVNYLQAQVGILQFMWSFQEFKGTTTEELQVVPSPVIQEKLYLENKCLVPKEFVEMLAKHFDAQPKPSISNNLKQLLTSSG